MLWWYLAVTRGVTPPAAVYASAVALVIGGLLLAWHRVQARYGDLSLTRIGGLARPMPRFAALFLLLVMAATGLPPFGLFTGFVEMLLTPPVALSGDLAIPLLAWLMASFYLFKMMQRLLFGPHRTDIPYEDLRLPEAAPLLIVLLILLALGVVPFGFFESGTPMNSNLIVMESTLWDRLWHQ